jgi:hypothetical protein
MGVSCRHVQGLLLVALLLAVPASCGPSRSDDNCRIVAEKLRQCRPDGTGGSEWDRYQSCSSCIADCVSRLTCKQVNDGQSVEGCVLRAANTCD